MDKLSFAFSGQAVGEGVQFQFVSVSIAHVNASGSTVKRQVQYRVFSTRALNPFFKVMVEFLHRSDVPVYEDNAVRCLAQEFHDRFDRGGAV